MKTGDSQRQVIATGMNEYHNDSTRLA